MRCLCMLVSYTYLNWSQIVIVIIISSIIVVVVVVVVNTFKIKVQYHHMPDFFHHYNFLSLSIV